MAIFIPLRPGSKLMDLTYIPTTPALKEFNYNSTNIPSVFETKAFFPTL
jgi:hypothetical protein